MGLTRSTAPSVAGGVLAVDAGNSKTDVAIVAADGSVLGTARGGGFRPPRDGADEAVAGLAPLVATAAAEAGVTAGDRPLVAHVSACLANADFPVEERRLEAALRSRGWGRDTQVANDTFAILRAGVEEPRGVAVVCGTGINCVGMLPDGRTARFPAIGRMSGDWGGGGFLADEVMWRAARAEDGRGEPTALADAVTGHFGTPSVSAVIEALHFGRIGRSALQPLAPLLFRVAEDGDPVARRIVDRQAQEVVAMARVAMDRLDLLDEPVPVVLGGSVLAARHPRLVEGIAARLAAVAPKAVPHVVTAPPVLGAALLGLDRVGGSAAARARLRTRFGAPAGH